MVTLLPDSWPVFAAEKSRRPVTVPGPPRLAFPVLPTPILPLAVTLVICSVVPPKPSKRTPEFAASPRLMDPARTGAQSDEAISKATDSAVVAAFPKEKQSSIRGTPRGGIMRHAKFEAPLAQNL